MVDVESPPNAILRRPWLHMVKVVSFIYHQLVQCPTPTGTANIRGNQAMSRTISAIARKKSKWKPKITKTVSDEDLPVRKK